jgi:thioredoxin-like negative regulator of GroEL
VRRSTLLISILGALALTSGGLMTWRATHRAAQAPVPLAEGAGAACEPGSSCATILKAKRNAAVERPTGKPRLLAFSSHHCAACSKMEPVLTRAVRACAASDDVMRVDIDQDYGADLAAEYKIANVPTWITVDANGAEIARISGVQPEQRIEAALEEVRGARCDRSL